MALTFGNVENTDWVITTTVTNSSLNANLPPVVAGNLIVLFTLQDHTTALLNTPSGYNSLGFSADQDVEVFWKIADGSETTVTLTLSTSTSNIKCIACKLVGANLSTPFDVYSDTTTTAGSSWLTPAITTTVDNTIVFVGGGAINTLSWTSGDEPNSSTLVTQHNAESSWMGLAFIVRPTAGLMSDNSFRQWTNTQQAKHAFSVAIAPSAGTPIPVFTNHYKMQGIQ